LKENEKRFGLTFHRTFYLKLPALAQLVPIAKEASEHKKPELMSDDILRERTTLGVEYIPAMRRYGIACGLFDFDKDRGGPATRLGLLIADRDPSLMSEVTQWLMHYHLSAPQGPGPLFWYGLVTRTLRPGRTLRSSEVAQELADILREQGQKEPTPRALQSTATIFLGSYARSDGLQALGVLQEKDGVYTVLHPDPPPLWVLAYTLADYWEHHWQGQVTVNLSELTVAGGWASLFWMDSGTAGEQLQRLKRHEMVDLYRVAPPYQVVRLWQDKEVFLERAYARAGAEDD
jgi:hypothetical protein